MNHYLQHTVLSAKTDKIRNQHYIAASSYGIKFLLFLSQPAGFKFYPFTANTNLLALTAPDLTSLSDIFWLGKNNFELKSPALGR